jgi:hypothetical protein
MSSGPSKKITGGQWFMFAALIFALFNSNTDTGFNGYVFAFWIFLAWIISAPFRAASWGIARFNSHPCGACGSRIPNGQTVCGTCGTDALDR